MTKHSKRLSTSSFSKMVIKLAKRIQKTKKKQVLVKKTPWQTTYQSKKVSYHNVIEERYNVVPENDNAIVEQYIVL